LITVRESGRIQGAADRDIGVQVQESQHVGESGVVDVSPLDGIS